MARSGNARDQAGAASLAVALRPWNAAPMWFATARHRSPYVLRHPPLAAFASSQGPGKGGGQGRYCPQPGGAGKNDPERLRQVACSGEPAPVRMLGCARTPHDHRFVPRSGPPDQAGWVRPRARPTACPVTGGGAAHRQLGSGRRAPTARRGSRYRRFRLAGPRWRRYGRRPAMASANGDMPGHDVTTGGAQAVWAEITWPEHPGHGRARAG